MKACVPHYWIPGGWLSAHRFHAMWVEGVHASLTIGRLTVRIWLTRRLWFWEASPSGAVQLGPLAVDWDRR